MATASLPHPRRDRGTARIAAEAAGPLGAVEDDRSGIADLRPGPAPEERFEVARRGYDRRQVEEFVDRSRWDAASLRNRLAQALREAEQLRVDLAAARRAAWEAAAQRKRVAREFAALRIVARTPGPPSAASSGSNARPRYGADDAGTGLDATRYPRGLTASQ
jgi:hypothetical protein